MFCGRKANSSRLRAKWATSKKLQCYQYEDQNRVITQKSVDVRFNVSVLEEFAATAKAVRSWKASIGTSGVTQIRPCRVTSKPAMLEAQDRSSDWGAGSLSWHGQCLERNEAAAGDCAGAAGL